jgi:transcriptional antiterminator NusG
MDDPQNTSVTEKGLGAKVIPGHMVINDNVEASSKAHWYVVHTYSGHEARVAETLRQRVATLGQTDKVFELLIPTQDKIQIKHGKKSTVKEKIFPGYLLIKMLVDDDSWLVVRTTQGITGFVGTGNKPTPLSPKEVEAIMQFASMGAPKYKANFSVGEAVKITDGPFSDFLGSVESIDEEHGKIRVLVSIFGRETPVELDFMQVKKI